MTLLAALLLSALRPDADVQKAVRAVAAAAIANAAKPEKERLKGDALADAYIRAAFASGAPARQAVLALGHALDATCTLAKHPLLRDAYKEVETPEEQKARLAALGSPTLRGRDDWLRHFLVAGALALLTDEQAAESAGIQKEVADARAKDRGDGTGFSCSDLSANYAGIAFAMYVTGEAGPKALPKIAASFRGADFLPEPPEGPDAMTTKEFEAAWGGVGSPRFKERCAKLKLRVQGAAGYSP